MPLRRTTMEVHELVFPYEEGMAIDFARPCALRQMRDADVGVPPAVAVTGLVRTVAFAGPPRRNPGARNAALGDIPRPTGLPSL